MMFVTLYTYEWINVCVCLCNEGNEWRTLIGTVPMVTMAQSAANWCNTHTQVDRTLSLTRLHQHSYDHVVRSTSSAITAFGIKFLFGRYLREYLYVYACVCVCVSISVGVCMCVHAHACMCVYDYECVCVCAWTNAAWTKNAINCCTVPSETKRNRMPVASLATAL